MPLYSKLEDALAALIKRRPAGVHVGKPSLELIEALDRLMQGVAA